MRYLLQCLSADFQKTKRLPIRSAHILIPICAASTFIGYYNMAPWNTYLEVEAYVQVLGISLPLLIGLFSAALSEQEQTAGNFQTMLSVSSRLPLFISKLILLILFGAFSLLLASFLFGVGCFFAFEQQVVGFAFYGKAVFILLGSSIFLYIWHLFLSLRFNKGVSLGAGVAESLVSALLLTGMGDVIWIYVPCAWPARFVTYAFASACGRDGMAADLKLPAFICVIVTVIILILYGSWALTWEGQNTGD